MCAALIALNRAIGVLVDVFFVAGDMNFFLIGDMMLFVVGDDVGVCNKVQ